MGLANIYRQLRGEKSAALPSFDGEPPRMLSVGRSLFEDPSVVELSDGRTLGYAETGDTDGKPVLTFHGIPSGRLGATGFDQVGRELGVRVIAPERPGAGVSDLDPDRELTDWAADVAELLDALDINHHRFAP